MAPQKVKAMLALVLIFFIGMHVVLSLHNLDNMDSEKSWGPAEVQPKETARHNHKHASNATTIIAPPYISNGKPPNPHGSLMTTFKTWNYDKHKFPCFPAETEWYRKSVGRSPTREGIMFVRNMKTGSSTVGGITIRIARSQAKKEKGMTWGTKVPMCKTRFDHTAAKEYEFEKRDKNRSFLFSFVRDPTKRLVSQFFHFGASREKIEPTDENFQDYITSRTIENYYMWDMGLLDSDPEPPWEDHVKTILQGYNFIGVTERMQESLVVLKLLLQLELRDILYLSAKGSGGFDDGASQNGCTYIIPSFVSPGMKKWLAAPSFQQRIAGDQLLYDATVQSLDATIDSLGREEVERQVVIFRSALKKAEEACFEKTRFPCSSDGKRQTIHDCIWWDSGCGYNCLDNLDIPELDFY